MFMCCVMVWAAVQLPAMKNKYIDAHCHLQNVPDVNSALAAARAAGVCGVICNATAPNDWAHVMQIAQNNDMVRGAIGVHPWNVQNLPDNWAHSMRDILAHNLEMMVGEIGMDKYHPDLRTQAAVFTTCVDLACEFARPVFVHCVGAWDKVLQILKSRHVHLPRVMVAHGFNGSQQILEQLISRYNFYISVSPMILDGRRSQLPDIVRQTPDNRILIESDGTNPAIVVDVAKRIAEIKGVANEQMADIIYNNTVGIL